MIVFDTEMNWKYIYSLSVSPSALVEYVENFVPTWARCVPRILDNQRYMVAVRLNQSLAVPYKVKQPYIIALQEHIRVSGLVNVFTPLTTLIESTDKEALINEFLL